MQTCLCTMLFRSTFQLVVEWILKLAETERQTTQLNQQSVPEVAKLQATGLVAIAITEAVLPQDAQSKLTFEEVGDIAKLLSYRRLSLSRILECQTAVCKLFSTGKCKTK